MTRSKSAIKLLVDGLSIDKTKTAIQQFVDFGDCFTPDAILKEANYMFIFIIVVIVH